MTDTPRVSVIVPVYNAEKTIGRCLESILAQTMPDLEIIAVDDGSPDGSANIVEAYAARDDRVHFIKQDNGGSGAARNTGLEHASGHYVSFIDSDDHIEQDMLALMLEAAGRYDAQVVNCEASADVQDESGNVKSSTLLRLPFDDPAMSGFEAFRHFSVLVPPILTGGCFKLIRKDVVAKGLRFPEDHRFGEDMVVSAFAFLNSATAAFVHRPLYHYVRSESVNTMTYSIQKGFDVIADMEDICGYAHDVDFNDELDTFKLEMIFSAQRQIAWSQPNGPNEKKQISATIDSLMPTIKPKVTDIEMPLMQRIKRDSTFHGYAYALCRIAYGLRWMPLVKYMM